ncbi:MAG: 2-C-methyl-D-erythritol 2,4-cyclodiphosphate synthase, partial [Bacteroidota bacterium]
NIDATVCLEAPKVNPHIPAMKSTMAEVMQVDESAISIKATTSEKMGFVGRKEGIASHAVALIMINDCGRRADE